MADTSNCNCGTKPCGKVRCCGSCPEKETCEVACKTCVPRNSSSQKGTNGKS